jgi:two-component system, sensor histidine kinase PdtaS
MNETMGSLYRSIGERNAAIREIHHRVKNNLQLIASLVSLQAAGAREEETVGALLTLGRRVMAMAFVHEELDLDREIEGVNAGRLFERIAMAVKQSTGGGKGVDASIDCGGIILGLERAIPLGLILGEALSNSYRHAFPQGRAGAIRVSLEGAPDGGLELRVRDDGVGFDASEAKGLGMDIIEALARQLRAGYRYGPCPGGGALFELRAPG